MEQRQLVESQPGCSYETRNETCKLCGLNIPGGMEMSAHIEQHFEYAKFHDKDGHDKYHCDYCHAIFETDEIYGKHVIEEHRNEDDYSCPFCVLKFQKTDDLIDHVRVLHSDYKCPATSAWKCRDCSTVFENNAAWSNHTGRKLSRQEGLCPLCKKYYCNRQLLREHQHNVHNMRGQTYGKYFCQPCNKYFQNRKTFKVHNNFHDGGKYKCETCDAKYDHPDQLARHKQNYHVRKSWECKQCDIQFCVKGSWVRHMNTHAPPEEWKYMCHACDGAKFPTLDKLSRHMKKDENKHKVNCGLCQYECLGKDTMRRHYNQIHGVNFYTP